MKIPRFYSNLDSYLKPNKVLVLYGPRQVGKTTLLNDYLDRTELKYRIDFGEDIRIREIIESQDFQKIKDYASGYELLAIDEAQKIPAVGSGLKIIVDQIPGIHVIATGSSSFDLAGQIGEPLTGRKITLTLYPVSQMELQKLYNPFELRINLENYLIYGTYPEVTATEEKKAKTRILNEITSSYLLKDILALDRVKSSKILVDLLRLLAFQIGSQVSLNEIGQKLGIDYKTVSRYIDLLEKNFVLFTLRGYSRNLRNEISKKSKYYFFDTGIRNSLIANLNPLELRNDLGKLWENFLIIERLKKLSYQEIPANSYFWRTWQQKEIDYLEEREGRLFAYEFKWQGKTRAPKSFKEAYPKAEFQVINRENYLNFII